MRPGKFSNVIQTSICGLVVATVGQFPVFAGRERPIRTGLWVIQPLAEDSNTLSAFAAGVRSNPQLTGVCIHGHWKEIEKEAGNLNSSAIDKMWPCSAALE